MPIGLSVLDIETNEISSLSSGSVDFLDPVKVDVINPKLGTSVIVSNVHIDAPFSSSIKLTGVNTLSPSAIGSFSTSVGAQALNSATGNYNSAFGYASSRDNTTGQQNTALGSSALLLNTTGSDNTGVGYNALGNSTGSSNVGIGATSGGVSSGSDNISIGVNSAFSSTSGNNNIVIGSMATKASATASDSITLGNSSHNVLRCQVTSITSLSDSRDKKNIEDSKYGLSLVESLKPVTFEWDTRDGAKKDIKDLGFIAQELKEVDDDYLGLVYDENPEKLEASYGRLIPVLVKAIQELSEEVKQLKSK
jgi:hypothetical protein